MTMLTPDFSSKHVEIEPSSLPVSDSITELLRSHAKHLIYEALEAEAHAVIDGLRQSGAEVARNGYLPERKITSAIGHVGVKVPRIRSKDGQSVNFTSTLVPRYLKRSKSISAWAAYAYLKGASDRDMASVLEVVLGNGAKKLTQ